VCVIGFYDLSSEDRKKEKDAISYAVMRCITQGITDDVLPYFVNEDTLDVFSLPKQLMPLISRVC